VFVHAGQAFDLGSIRLAARDPQVTNIGPAGGTATDSQGKIEVVIPPGALTTTIAVQITPFASRDDLPTPLPNNTVTMYGFELEPSGTVFAQPVTVRVRNDKSLPTSLQIPTGYVDDAGRWQHDAVGIWDGARFAFQTSHFSERDMNASAAGQLAITATSSHDSNEQETSCHGSTVGVATGALGQTFSLPPYEVRGESFGLSVNYVSQLAASTRRRRHSCRAASRAAERAPSAGPARPTSTSPTGT
jgi:hypothetical protein